MHVILSKRPTILLFFLLIIAVGCSESNKTQLLSPDGAVRVEFVLKSGSPAIDLRYNNEELVESISLGLSFLEAPDIQGDLRIAGIQHGQQDTTYATVWGKASHVRNHYNEVTIDLLETSETGRKLTVVLRAYNDGVAFRYVLPEQPHLREFRLAQELTTIRFAGDYPSYGLIQDSAICNYEAYYEQRNLSEFSGTARIGLPLLVETPNGWLAVLEADLTDYAGMSLARDPERANTFFTTMEADADSAEIAVQGRTPHRSPWRVFMIADHPGAMIESNLVWNLNDPHEFDSTDWIKPGVVIWPWWNGRIAMGESFSGEPSTALMQYYTDFAAEQGIPYLLVDAGWYSLESDAWDQPREENIFTMEETRAEFYDIRQVIDYATHKGVKVLLWVHLESIRDKVEQALSTYADWGVSGVKVDSYGGEYQTLVQDLHHILQVAAEHQLTVDYHGAYKPTGVERTYPNFLTREGVLGLEYTKWSWRNKITSTHDVTIPYTRMLLGHMDYTPGAFDLDGTENHPKRIYGTRAHQMAMYVVYFSPLQMLVDYPAVYREAQAQFDFIKNVPTVWDETRFLQGEVGEYIVLARRKGMDWYVGAMTNESSREVELPLDFLYEDAEYTAHIYRDGPDADINREHVVDEKRQVTNATTLEVTLAKGGGMAGWLKAGLSY